MTLPSNRTADATKQRLPPQFMRMSDYRVGIFDVTPHREVAVARGAQQRPKIRKYSSDSAMFFFFGGLGSHLFCNI